MKLVACFLMIVLATAGNGLAQNVYADFSNYPLQTALADQNANIAFNAGSGIAGTFNIRFATTSTAIPPWALTTTSSPYFGLPPPQFVPGNPTGADVPVAFFTTFVTSNILSSTSSIDFIGFKGQAGSTTTVTFDFTGLSTGFLPAGSKLAWVDTDFGETTTITGAAGWYSGTVLLGDITNGVLTGTSEADAANPWMTANTSNSSTLVLTGLAGATDSPGAIITTLVNLTSLTATVASTANGATYFQGLALAAVPEPSTLALAALGLLGVGAVRKRRRP